MSHALLEGWNADALRNRINDYAPYAGALIEVTYLAEDAGEIRVEMPLSERNANIVGTHFGGSLYSMVDPHPMILLTQRLGPGYVIWDQAATINFLRPGRGTVYATVRVTDSDVEAIRSATARGQKYLPQWELEITDGEGEVVASVLKTLYVRRRRG